MIKKVIAAALVTVISSQADAATFNGFGFGFNGGVLMAHNKLSHTVAGFSKIKSANKTRGIFGMQFDYEMSKTNSLYSRIGVTLSLPAGKVSSTTRVAGQNDIKFTAKNGLMTELQAAMGYNAGTDVVAYGLVGLSVSKKTYSLSQGNVKSSHSKTKVSPVLGLGMIKKVNNNFSVGVEYKHTFEPGLKYVNKFTGQKSKIDSNSDVVLARVSYHF